MVDIFFQYFSSNWKFTVKKKYPNCIFCCESNISLKQIGLSDQKQQ